MTLIGFQAEYITFLVPDTDSIDLFYLVSRVDLSVWLDQMIQKKQPQKRNYIMHIIECYVRGRAADRTNRELTTLIPGAGFNFKCSRRGYVTPPGDVWQPDNCILKRHLWGSNCIPSTSNQGAQRGEGLNLRSLHSSGRERHSQVNKNKHMQLHPVKKNMKQLKVKALYIIQGILRRWHWRWALMNR